MIKQEILDYISTSPQNTNPAVLSTMLDSFAETVGGNSGGDVPIYDFTFDFADLASEEEQVWICDESTSAFLNEKAESAEPFFGRVKLVTGDTETISCGVYTPAIMKEQGQTLNVLFSNCLDIGISKSVYVFGLNEGIWTYTSMT